MVWLELVECCDAIFPFLSRSQMYLLAGKCSCLFLNRRLVKAPSPQAWNLGRRFVLAPLCQQSKSWSAVALSAVHISRLAHCLSSCFQLTSRPAHPGGGRCGGIRASMLLCTAGGGTGYSSNLNRLVL